MCQFPEPIRRARSYIYGQGEYLDGEETAARAERQYGNYLNPDEK